MATSPFFDHFDDASLAARWGTAVGADGSVTETGSVAQLDYGGAAGSEAILYYDEVLQPTEDWLLFFCIKINSDQTSDHIALLTGEAGGPTLNTLSAWDAKNAFRLERASISGDQEWLVSRYDSGGNREQWDGSSWVNPSVATGFEAEVDDFLVAAIENDGTNQQWRVHLYSACDQPGTEGDDLSGLRTRDITGWTAWSNTQVSSDLYFVTGWPYTDFDFAGTVEVEWVRYLEGAKKHIWLNGKDQIGDNWRIYHAYSYGSWDDGLLFVRDDESTIALDVGAPGEWDDLRVRGPRVAEGSNGTYYMAYSGDDTSSNLRIGIASASSPDGPWTKFASNPVIDRTGSGEQVFFSYLIEDTGAGKWYIMAAVHDGTNWRIDLWETTDATPDTTNWTRVGTMLSKGTAGEWDETGVSNPVLVWDAANQQWIMLYGGIGDPNAVGEDNWGWGRATAPAIDGPWTKDPSNPFVPQNEGPITSLTAGPTAERSLSVSDETGFEPDAPVVLTDDVTDDNSILSRVRSTSAGTIELYHSITYTASAEISQINGADQVPTWIVQRPGGDWLVLGTMFDPFGDASQTSLDAYYEGSGVWTMSALDDATPTRVWELIPLVPHGAGVNRSFENPVGITQAVSSSTDQTISLPVASAQAEAPAPSPSPGDPSPSVPVATATAEAPSPGVAASVGLSVPVAGIQVDAPAPAVSPGGMGIATPVAGADVTSPAPGMSPGPADVALPVAAVVSEAPAPSPSTSVAVVVPVAEVLAEADPPVIGSQDVTLALPVPTALAEAPAPGIAPGPVVLATGVAQAVAEALTPSLSASAAVAVPVAAVNGEAPSPGVTPSVALGLGLASVTGEAPTPGVTPGRVGVVVPVALVTVEAPTPGIVVGAFINTVTGEVFLARTLSGDVSVARRLEGDVGIAEVLTGDLEV